MNNDQPAILAARGLEKSFPSGERRIEVLKGIDLRLAAGETVSISGESGSGKTTLLNLLGGLEKVDAGSILWNETPVERLSMQALAERRAPFIGMVFQAFYLVPELHALDNVLLSARILGRMTNDDRKRAADLLGRVGLGERGHHLPTQLSGGERQRVALARALMNRPRLILADEPTGNLDERTGNTIIDLLLNLCREEHVGMVLVTHNKEHAAKTGRQLLLHFGRLQGA